MKQDNGRVEIFPVCNREYDPINEENPGYGKPEEKNPADYILILPLPGIPPIYIYIRNNPGQVTGQGQKVSGIWLSDVNTGNGSPVPAQIADRLRGRTFANFSQFREACVNPHKTLIVT